MKFLCLSLVLCTVCAHAQTYTYSSEGFEEDVWAKAGTNVTSTTGKWTTNKNIHSTEQAYDGSKSLKISQKAGIITPELSHGAGTLIYYARVDNRQVTVETSTDGTNWNAIESYKETTDWTKHIVSIYDAKVRYIKISTTSNNQVYIDNIVVSRADGTLADGSTPVPQIDVAYFTQDFEKDGSCPSAKPSNSSEIALTVADQGEWRFSNAYKGTNTSYITDGSARSLRMLKNGSYVVSPILDQGVAKVRFNEGRKDRTLKLYGSADEGATWTLLKTISSATMNELELFDRNLNRIKLANEGSSDADVDNLCITGFPEGKVATVTTGDVESVGGSKAIVLSSLVDVGDKKMIEWGVCWSTDEESCRLPLEASRVVGDLNATQASLQLTGLPCETTIYYRAYALSMAGVGYGEVKSFVTLSASAPTLTMETPAEDPSKGDDVHVFMALKAAIVDNGGAQPSETGFCYNTIGTPVADGNDVKTTAYLYGSEFGKSVPLKPETTYYVRAYAINSAGIGYSQEFELTTPRLVVPTYEHNVYYVSPNGDDLTADGSEEKPFFNLQKAVDKATAGDTIYMLASTYQYSARINIPTAAERNSGMIILRAKDGRAILDFKAQGLGDSNQGIRLTGSYWHIYGIDICNAGDNGMLIERNKPSGGNYDSIKDKTNEGNHNLIENCRFYRNMDTGLQMKNLAENNMIINCDSYFNSDPDHEDADGFAVKISHGTGNYFFGCRAWQNCDDGWDGYVKTDGGFPDGQTTTFENCWAFKNGYLEDGGTTGNGDGNGFKLGSAYGDNNVILNRCLAFENYQKGFDQNHNTGSMIFNNCSGFAMPLTSNKSHFTYRIDEPVSRGREVRFTNCVAISDGISDRNKSVFAPYSISGEAVTIVTSDFNTLPEDYQSIDLTGMDGERDANGNLPVVPFMRIAEGNSKLIDKGTQVVPYQGESEAA